jgi:integrase
MPSNTDIARRNRAVVAFTLLTGARDGAVASFKLKHVDMTRRCVHQDARDVKTKYSKTFVTYFFPVGDDPLAIVGDWVNELRNAKLWGNDDPLFPATRVEVGSDAHFKAIGLQRAHWSDAAPVREIFKRAFLAAGQSYFNPHSLRSTIVRLGETLCQTPEEFKAWSQNMGHEGVLTTFQSYGSVPEHRQGQIIESLAHAHERVRPSWDIDHFADALIRRMQQREV